MAEDNEKDEKKSKFGKVGMILALLVVAMITAGVTWWFTKSSAPVTPETVPGAMPADTQAKASYYPMKPPFVVNFVARGKQRLVQINVVLMARSDLAIEGIQAHQALIRNAIVLKIGAANFNQLQTNEGKELLRQTLRNEVNTILEQEGLSLIDDLYFTNFVMQ